MRTTPPRRTATATARRAGPGLASKTRAMATLRSTAVAVAEAVAQAVAVCCRLRIWIRPADGTSRGYRRVCPHTHPRALPPIYAHAHTHAQRPLRRALAAPPLRDDVRALGRAHARRARLVPQRRDAARQARGLRHRRGLARRPRPPRRRRRRARGRRPPPRAVAAVRLPVHSIIHPSVRSFFHSFIRCVFLAPAPSVPYSKLRSIRSIAYTRPPVTDAPSPQSLLSISLSRLSLVAYFLPSSAGLCIYLSMLWTTPHRARARDDPRRLATRDAARSAAPWTLLALTFRIALDARSLAHWLQVTGCWLLVTGYYYYVLLVLILVV